MDIKLSNFNLNLLSQKQLPLVTVDTQNAEWFSTNYQSRAQKKHPEYYSLRTLLEAVNNSESTFEQFPVDERNAKDIARSIFVDSFWMQRDVTLGSIDGDLYIVGGRHRLTAIANVFAQVVRYRHAAFAWSEVHLEGVFNSCLDMYIRCDILYLGNREDLLTLISADNESRRMRKAEFGHLIAQAHGADSASLDSISDTIFSSDLTPQEVVTIAAQNFTRRQHNKLKPQTRQILGERIAKHILYGSDPTKRLAIANKLKVRSKAEFEYLMNRAWDILNDEIKDQIVIALKASSLAKEVTEKLDEEQRQASLLPEITVEAPKPLLVEPTKVTRGSRKLAKA